LEQSNKTLVLASSSQYRKDQLAQFGLAFEQFAPDIDETPLASEMPSDTALRLAVEKCKAVMTTAQADVVIGSDQVCTFNGQQYGKPGSFEKAVKQLQTFSGNCIEFFTAVCVMTADGQLYKHNELTRVMFRELDLQEIENYLAQDQPFNCAGSFKMESKGLSLFTAVESRDPSALLGLPLIKLCEFLRRAGIRLF
jgi:septum formation protein